MINPLAVAIYLGRKFKDSEKAKHRSEDYLDARLAELDPPVKFYRKPRKHQKACFLLGLNYTGYAFWLDQGLGKTGLSLDLAWYFAKRDGFRSLVLVPYGNQVAEWASSEGPIHRPDLRTVGVSGTPLERAHTFWEAEADLVVCTYAGFLTFLCGRVAVEDENGETKRNKMVLDPELVEKALARFQVIFADEATQLANAQSTAFKILRKMREGGLPRLYELTGTPFGDDPHLLWSQYYLVDLGETLGATLGIFRAAFFTTKRNFFGGFEYKFKKSLEPLLKRFVRNRAIRYVSEEVEDLPPVIGGLVSKTGFVVRKATLHKATVAYFEQAVKDLRAARGNYTETENAWHRLRRISSGYLLPKNEVGEELPLIFPINPKLDLLLSMIEQVDTSRQIMVFCYYRKTVEIVAEALKKRKLTVSTIYGKQAEKAQLAELGKFRTGKTRILVANEAAAYGLNIQCASVVLVFESPTKPIVRRQMEKRAWRFGQTRRVFIYDLVTEMTGDEKILKALAEGKDVFDGILRGSDVC